MIFSSRSRSLGMGALPGSINKRCLLSSPSLQARELVGWLRHRPLLKDLTEIMERAVGSFSTPCRQIWTQIISSSHARKVLTHCRDPSHPWESWSEATRSKCTKTDLPTTTLRMKILTISTSRFRSLGSPSMASLIIGGAWGGHRAMSTSRATKTSSRLRN